MNIVSEKPGGRAHRMWPGVLSTPDPLAFYVPAGSPVREANGTEWSSPYPVILQFWPQRYYQVCHLFKPSGPAYYCNIIAPPVYHPNDNQISFIDLELDVIVEEGHVQLADEEEFRAAPLTENYRMEALRAAAYVQALANMKSGPFSAEAAASWLRWLQARPNDPVL